MSILDYRIPVEKTDRHWELSPSEYEELEMLRHVAAVQEYRIEDLEKQIADYERGARPKIDDPGIGKRLGPVPSECRRRWWPWRPRGIGR